MWATRWLKNKKNEGLNFSKGCQILMNEDRTLYFFKKGAQLQYTKSRKNGVHLLSKIKSYLHFPTWGVDSNPPLPVTNRINGGGYF